jgi:hypothetical protein
MRRDCGVTLITWKWRDKISLPEFEWLAFPKGSMRIGSCRNRVNGRSTLELVSHRKEDM